MILIRAGSIFVLLMSIASAALAAERPLPLFTQDDLTPYWESEFGAAEKNGPHPATVTHFAVKDQDRHAVTEQAMSGRVSLVNFFFASCGTICPLMMENLKQTQAKMDKAEIKNVRLFSFSVTPEADDPDRLKRYAGAHHLDLSRWSLLTGDRADIFRLGRAVFKAGGAGGSDKSFTHSNNVYLVDAQLHLRGIYDSSSRKEMDLLVQDVARLEKEGPTNNH